GDVFLALACADDARIPDSMRRGPVWGVETVGGGAGSTRPEPGAADHVIWVDTDEPLGASELFVRIYHLLWELTHVCFEHPGLLKPAPDCAVGGEVGSVCVTCSDEGRPAEVVTVDGDEALVRTPDGQERIDVSLIDAPAPGDLVLIHAGFAIQSS
ncbi:MAG: HypC/HybG/HupF family hydrogenase formation chaperone, partial [Acidimicrobiales bacterium]